MKLSRSIILNARPYLKNGVRNPQFDPADQTIVLKSIYMNGRATGDNDFTISELNRILRDGEELRTYCSEHNCLKQFCEHWHSRELK